MIQSKKYLRKLAIYGHLLVLVILCTACGNKKEWYSCQNIPVGDGKLNWGMSTDEIKEVLGNPTLEAAYEYGNGICMTYEYGTPVKCGLGACSGFVLYVGEKKDGFGGLATIEMTMDKTTKESVVEKLADFYGELSPRGGSTQMERDLKKANPDYFNEAYWCDAWKMETLTEEEFDLMTKSYNAVTGDEGATLKQETLLMDVTVSGIQSEETYRCKVELYAVKMCLWENLGL